MLKSAQALPVDHGFTGVEECIVNLARMQYPREPLKRALYLFLRKKGTTGQGEDLHAAATLEMRQHPQFCEVSCKVKSFLAYSKCVVIQPVDNTLLRLEHKLSRAQRIRPGRIHALNLYLRDVMQQALKDIVDPAARKAASMTILSQHGLQYKALPQSVKDLYVSMVNQ